MRSDLEISKALALAIGWKYVFCGMSQCSVCDGHGWQVFDYRNEVISFRVAKKFDCFPEWEGHTKQWFAFIDMEPLQFAETPQKAIAMAVINGVKARSASDSDARLSGWNK